MMKGSGFQCLSFLREGMASSRLKAKESIPALMKEFTAESGPKTLAQQPTESEQLLRLGLRVNCDAFFRRLSSKNSCTRVAFRMGPPNMSRADPR